MMSQLNASTIKGFFAGSGVAALSEKAVVDRLLTLTGRFDTSGERLKAPVRVAYIGTATYDLPQSRDVQVKWLAERGCEIGDVRIADPSKATLDHAELDLLNAADIVLVSGGNTLYAIRRWEETGLNQCLRAAALRGAILAGGSAGAICWFTSGHSDSADPSTYAMAMIRAAMNQTDEKKQDDVKTSWSYIRVHGLDILPGLVCPHHDKEESNGVPRLVDFEKMLKRHPTERGICIDHWAALVLPGDGTYEVFATPGKKCETGTVPQLPGVYVKDVVEGQIQVTALGRVGKLEELLRRPSGPLVRDPFEMYFAMENPTASTERPVRPPGM